MKSKLAQLFGWAGLVAIVFGVAQLTEAQSSGGFPSRPTFLSGVVRGLWAMQSCTVGGVACATGTIPTSANPTATVGPAATNGSGTAYMLANAAPALCLTCTYTQTGPWTFTNTLTGTLTGGASLDGALTGNNTWSGTNGFSAGALSYGGAATGVGTTGIFASGRSALPVIDWINAAAVSGQRAWIAYADSSGVWHLSAQNDAQNVTNDAIAVTQTAGIPTAVNVVNGTLQQGGTSVCLSSGTNCPTGSAASTGTVTLTYTSGCTTGTATASGTYSKIGNLASVRLGTSAGCTTAATGANIVYAGWPAAILPAATIAASVLMNSAGVAVPAACTITTGGAVTCQDNAAISSDNVTGIFAGAVLSYPLN